MKVDAGAGERSAGDARHEAEGTGDTRHEAWMARDARHGWGAWHEAGSILMETSRFFLIMGRSDLVRRPSKDAHLDG